MPGDLPDGASLSGSARPMARRACSDSAGAWGRDGDYAMVDIGLSAFSMLFMRSPSFR